MQILKKLATAVQIDLAFLVLLLCQTTGIDGSDFVSYSVYDDASWAVLDSQLNNDILCSNRQGLYNEFMEKCREAAGDNAEHLCNRDESFRMQMNMYQPRSVRIKAFSVCWFVWS